MQIYGKKTEEQQVGEKNSAVWKFTTNTCTICKDDITKKSREK